MMWAVQTLSDYVHARTGLSSFVQSAWMFALAAAVALIRATMDIVVDPLGNPASVVATMLFLSILVPAVIANLISPSREQAAKASFLLGVAIAAGGSIDLFVWSAHAVIPIFGGVRSMSALAGVAVGMGAVRAATVSFRQEQASRAAAQAGRLPLVCRLGPLVAGVSVSLLTVSCFSLALTGVSFSSVMICLSFAFGFAGGLLLMCVPRPPSWRRARRRSSGLALSAGALSSG